MAKKRVFRFYVHHGSSLDFLIQTQTKKLRHFFKEVIFGVCYRFGFGLYKAASAFIRSFKKDLKATHSNFKKRFSLLSLSFIKTLGIFLLLAAFAYGGVLTVGFIAKAVEIKNSIVGLGKQGQKYLLDAKAELQKNNPSAAQNKFSLALESFQNAQDQLSNENILLGQILNLVPQKQEADKLLLSASLLSQAGKNLSESYQTLRQYKFSSKGLEFTGPDKPKLVDLSENLAKSLEAVNQAGQTLLKINTDALPENLKGKLALAKENFAIIQNALTGLKDILKLGSDLFGGQKNLLLIFENNNELRPGGGFMGTYGNLKLDEGQIKNLTISSVYDLDGQLVKKIAPPFPMVAVNDRWFLRDTNWFSDFPQSAKKISTFYELEGGETPDGILVMTPSLVQNLLKLTGPISMARYNVTLDADNFVELTQIESSVNYDRVQNRPKQILADLMPVLLEKIGKVPEDQWPKLLETVQAAFSQKQILLYSRNDEAEDLINQFNWGGKITGTDRDYLNLSFANLNGHKTDLYINQQVRLKTEIKPDGSVINELSVTRKNQMPKMPGTENSGFLKILVPLGSTLISNSGFSENDLPKLSENNYEQDPDVAAWQKTVVKDITTDTSIGEEAGKTFFGNWVSTLGGESTTVKLTYKLPFKLSGLDKYSLIWQKQPGSLETDFDYSLDFSGRKIAWSSFSPQNLTGKDLSYSQKLNQDIILGLVLTK